MTWEGDVGYSVAKKINHMYQCIAAPCIKDRVLVEHNGRSTTGFCTVHGREYCESKYRLVEK